MCECSASDCVAGWVGLLLVADLLFQPRPTAADAGSHGEGCGAGHGRQPAVGLGCALRWVMLGISLAPQLSCVFEGLDVFLGDRAEVWVVGGWGGGAGGAFVRCYSCVPAASPHPCPHLSLPFLRPPPAPAAPADLIVRYAELLSSNGRLGMALEYLSMIPGEQALAGLAELCLKAAACGGHWLAQKCAAAPGALLPDAHPRGSCAPPRPSRSRCLRTPTHLLRAGEPSASVAALKYRIYQSAAGSAQLPDTVAPPPFPFTAGAWAAHGLHGLQQQAA